MTYISEREMGKVPRTETELTAGARRGIAALIGARIANGSFGAGYPDICPEGGGPIGTDATLFWDAMQGEVRGLVEPELMLGQNNPPPWHNKPPPPTLQVMDILQFCWQTVGKPTQQGYHEFWKHHHLVFDVEAGRAEFRAALNQIFRSNGLAYELTAEGEIQRLGAPVLREVLGRSVFATGNPELDKMLETARRKFLDPDEIVRREALEKLWDAWERLKTIETTHKEAGSKALLDRASGSSSVKFREMLETEAHTLRKIGNSFQIRHTETNQERLVSSGHVDYLFHRLLALILLILRSTDRGG
jgi:hypothetical protein